MTLPNPFRPRRDPLRYQDGDPTPVALRPRLTRTNRVPMARRDTPIPRPGLLWAARAVRLA